MGTHKLNLNVGQRHMLRLKGLGSAGYEWAWHITGNQDVIDVSAKQINFESKKPPERGEAPNNYDVGQLVTISAHQPGHVRLFFTLSRQWEREKTPIEQIIMEIIVTK